MKEHSKQKKQEPDYIEDGPEIKYYPNGIAAFPVMKLHEYCEKNGIGQDEGASFGLMLPGSSSDQYNFFLTDYDTSVNVLIHTVFYIDNGGGPNETDEREQIQPTVLMKRSIFRRFFQGEAGVCGVMHIDQDGRLWVDVMAEENLEAIMVFWIQPNTLGLEFSAFDPGTMMRVSCCRIMFDGETLYCEPVDFTSNVPPA